MSNKENLPVKFEKAGKPKVKEQVTERVEQVEVFNGFNFDFGLLSWTIFGLLSGLILFFLIELVLPFSDALSICLTTLWFGWNLLMAGYHWEERFSGGVVTYVLHVVCSLSIATVTTVLLGVFVVAVTTNWEAPLSVVWLFAGLMLIHICADFLVDSAETRTEKQIISDKGGEQL